jgi:ABC-2 type transport system ATP-binding protein
LSTAGSDSMAEISIDNLTKRYGDLTALDNVSLKINTGQVFGLLGPNGAGKSTLLKTLVGILKPTSGTINVKGHDIVREPELAKRIIGYLPENPSLYTGLTTQEFLEFVGKIRGVDDDRLGREISDALNSFSLWEKRDSLIGSLSKGMKQKVAIIATSLHSPEVLVLDEPLTALDPKTRASVKEWIVSQTGKGVTTVLSTHELDIAQDYAETIGIIDRGRIVAVGGIESLRRMANTDSKARLEDVFLRLTAESSEKAG